MSKNASRSPKASRSSTNPFMLLVAAVGLVGSVAIAGLWVLPKFNERSLLTSEATAAETALGDASATLRGVKGECDEPGVCEGDDFSVTKARTDKADTFVEFMGANDDTAGIPDAFKVIALDRVATAATAASTEHDVGLGWVLYTPAGQAPTLTAVTFPVALTGPATAPRDFITAATQSGLVVTIINAQVAPARAGLGEGEVPATTVAADSSIPVGAQTLSESTEFEWTLTVALWYSSEPDVNSVGDPAAAPTDTTPLTVPASPATDTSTPPEGSATTESTAPQE